MYRLLTEKLLRWKSSSHRKPLMLRGARQVGKTWLVKDFGTKAMPGQMHLIDLEKHPEWHLIFEKDLDVNRIVAELELLLNVKINQGQDLLFLDEIQSCPRAIMALRYFYEDMPGLHVIAAGSLLEFTLNDISFPVGRLQIMHVSPLNFMEFLKAIGKTQLADLIVKPPESLPLTIHNKLIDLLRLYFFVGGMPECVGRYAENERLRDVFEVQSDLIATFRQDFSKYAPLADKQCLNTVLTSVARQVGRQIKYARLSDGFSHPTIKKAFKLLTLAQVIHKVSSVNPPEVPFGATISEKNFKSLLLDIGLMQQICNIPMDIEYGKSDLLSIYEGSMAEQFVGQEFISAGELPLYYWSRNAKSSTAEVDYLLTEKGMPLPVEVKSGPSGRLKSLHLFLKEYPRSQRGIVLSGAPFARLPEQNLEFWPLYYAYSLGNSLHK